MLGLGLSIPSVAVRQGGGGWSPAALFAGGAQGVWYDPYDLSTLYQDAAGTIPVTADGDPVGRRLDKSGTGNHARQTIDAKRPTYRVDGAQRWVQSDGADDYMDLAAYLPPALGGGVSAIVVVKPSNIATANANYGRGVIAQNRDNAGSWIIAVRHTGHICLRHFLAGQAVVGQLTATSGPLSNGSPAIISAVYDPTAGAAPADRWRLRCNGAGLGVTISNAGSGWGSTPGSELGRDYGFSDYHWLGGIGAVLVLDRTLSDADLVMIEGHLAPQYGVTL